MPEPLPPRHAWRGGTRRGARFAALMCASALLTAVVGGAGGWFAGPAGARSDSAAGPVQSPNATPSQGPTPPMPSFRALPRPSALAPSTVAIDEQLAADLATMVTSLEAAAGTKLGVAVLAAGSGPDAVVMTAGSWTSGHAWSTIKAPLAVAALGATPGGATDASAAKAITVSDNSAAEALWAGLGTADQAGAAVDAVLREGGDPVTLTQRTKTRPEFSPFGQTVWSLTDQAVFAADFPAGTAGDRVWGLMGQIDASQRWGLGAFEGARFKGGWGPDDSGYVVRQFGQIPVDGGCAAVAVGAWALDFDAGTRALTDLASALTELTGRFPAGACR